MNAQVSLQKIIIEFLARAKSYDLPGICEKYGIECNDCKASTKLFTNRNYAVIVWNRRGWNAEKIEKEYINYE